MSCFAEPYTLPTIDFIGGATQELVFYTYRQIGGAPYDLSSCTANFSVGSFINKSGEPIINKEMDVSVDGRDGHDTAHNMLSVTLTPSDTVDLSGKYIYQITVRRDGIADADIPGQGIMLIRNNINKRYTVQ